MILDAVLGEPRWLWDRFAHPAILFGRVIGWGAEKYNNGDGRFVKGLIFIVALSVLALCTGWILLQFGSVVEIIIAAILIAQKSLVDHVAIVARDLRYGVASGRKSVAMIVGRDTRDMTQPQVARAAIESAAENFGDGVIAPIFWFAIAGLPGLLAYKMVNTADSMIGYRTAEFEQFGKAAARLDDALNWIPARLTALLIAVVSGVTDAKEIQSDACLHRSPNAGWPEAAMARALNVALSGPRSYDGQMQDFPWVNATGAKDIGPAQIDAATKVLWRAWALLLGLVFAGIVLGRLIG
ncbi:MAG: adenosylcobinamide-phosphate synthase CbiB [Planktomarina sp.]